MYLVGCLLITIYLGTYKFYYDFFFFFNHCFAMIGEGVPVRDLAQAPWVQWPCSKAPLSGVVNHMVKPGRMYISLANISVAGVLSIVELHFHCTCAHLSSRRVIPTEQATTLHYYNLDKYTGAVYLQQSRCILPRHVNCIIVPCTP